VKRSIGVALLALLLTASVGSVAFALDGYVMVGGLVFADVDPDGTTSFPTHPVVVAELQVTDRLSLGASWATDLPGVAILTRYGAETGVYGDFYVVEGTLGSWSAGVFIERTVSDRLGLRAEIGLSGVQVSGQTVVIPDAVVGLRYELSGPFAFLAEVAYGGVGAGIAYEF